MKFKGVNNQEQLWPIIIVSDFGKHEYSLYRFCQDETADQNRGSTEAKLQQMVPWFQVELYLGAGYQ